MENSARQQNLRKSLKMPYIAKKAQKKKILKELSRLGLDFTSSYELSM